MRMYGRLGLHAESVVLPLLAADAPVVTWWHAAPPDRLATDALAVFADRRITDSSIAEDPLQGAEHPGGRLRPRRHRPGLDPHHAVAGHPRLHPGLGGRTPRRAGAGARRPDRGRPGERDRPAARRLAVLPLRCVHRRGGGHPDARAQRRRLRRPAARPGRGGAAAGRPQGRRGHLPALPARRRPSPCPTGSLGDLLSEELRRLDTDEPYSEALEAATGVTGLADRSAGARARLVRPDAEEGADGRSGAPTARRLAAPTRWPRPRPSREEGRRRPARRSHGDVAGALTGAARCPDIVVEPDADRLARAVAAALVARLAAAQAVHGTASVVLTGGGIGTAVLEQVAALAAEPDRDAASTGPRSTSGGATSASCRPTTTSATR